MAKKNELIPYSTVGAFKSKIRVSGQKIKKVGKEFASKATTEQKFLGKTLPRYIGKAAKLAFTRPITTTTLFFVPDLIKAAGKQKGIKFAENRQFDVKGRKFL